MGDNSTIEWTDATLNPIRARNLETKAVGWHCEVISAGCCKPGKITCYANRQNLGFFKLGTGLPYTRESRDKIEVFLDEATLLQPLHWRKPRNIFICSMTDLFGEWVKDEWIDRIFAMMALAPQHTFQVLTKRPERMLSYFSGHNGDWDCLRYADEIHHNHLHDMRGQLLPHLKEAGWLWASYGDEEDGYYSELEYHGKLPLPNVHLGVSAEDQAAADKRIPLLLQTPAAVRFVSAEPLLGPIDLTTLITEQSHTTRRGWDALKGEDFIENFTVNNRWENRRVWTSNLYPRLDWVIGGFESGSQARPGHPDWARSLRDTGISFFWKQHGEWLHSSQAITQQQKTACVVEAVSKPPRKHTWQDGSASYFVGKKAAGRLLDGREWNEMPMERSR